MPQKPTAEDKTRNRGGYDLSTVSSEVSGHADKAPTDWGDLPNWDGAFTQYKDKNAPYYQRPTRRKGKAWPKKG